MKKFRPVFYLFIIAIFSLYFLWSFDGCGTFEPPLSPPPVKVTDPPRPPANQSVIDNTELERFKERKFTFPPCFKTIKLNVDTSLSKKAILGTIGTRIHCEFAQKGFASTFWYVENGFAVISEMEQYDKSGKILDTKQRWSHVPRGTPFSFTKDYLRSLIFPKKCYLRVFVAVVKADIFSSEGDRATKDEAASWGTGGYSALPDLIANQPFTDKHSINILVYEFEVPDSNLSPEQACPTLLKPETHLNQARLFIKGDIKK